MRESAENGESVVRTNAQHHRTYGEQKKKVMCMAIESVLACGAPIWNKAAQKQVYRKKLISAQRLMMLRICPAGPGKNSADSFNGR